MIDVGRDFERMRDYVGGRLTEDERRTFEDRLVRDPELVREFEQTLQLREGLEQLREQAYFGKSAPRTGATGVRRFLLWTPALAAAAVAALAIILWVQPRSVAPSPGVLLASLEPGTGSGAGQPVNAIFRFVSMRGGSSDDLELPAGGLIEFRAAPSAHAAGSPYRVTLARAVAGGASQSIGTLTDLAPAADGDLHCYADASRLTAGHYELRVEPRGAAPGTGEGFAFKLHSGTAAPAR